MKAKIAHFNALIMYFTYMLPLRLYIEPRRALCSPHSDFAMRSKLVQHAGIVQNIAVRI